MVNAWIHARLKRAVIMPFAVFQSIVSFVCAQTDSEVNQHKDAHDQNVLSITIVKSINAVLEV